MIDPLDVVWIFDDLSDPQKWRMVVCICPELGYYFRINTKKRQYPIKLEKSPNHEFLSHDSYIECGEPYELDDYLIEEAVRKKGVVGQVHSSLAKEICETAELARNISKADKALIRKALGC